MMRARVVASRLALLALLAPLALLARTALAEAVLIVESSDDAGEGFDDPTPVEPVGGNMGETLGEQRMIAVQHAADLWGAALDSEVPIVISASFADQGCTSTGATMLASASAAGVQYGLDRDGADPDLTYPDALANRLRGSDFDDESPDIYASFNAAIDDDCLPGTQWYYGLDAEHGDGQDLVTVALHELGHGLGVQVFVDAASGAQLLDRPSAYGAHVLDLDIGERWSEMTNAERAASYTNARRVVWDGEHASDAAAEWLRAGRPELDVEPDVPGWSGLVSDASYGARLTMSVSAPLLADDSGCPEGAVSGAIVLLRAGCAWSAWVAEAEALGAVGALVTWSSWWTSPPAPVDELDPETVGIPVLAISPDDADALQAAAELDTVTVSMSLAAGLRGADAQGRVLLNATKPVDPGSSISHFDELARPHLLMEPIQKPVSRHDLDITPAMLRDLGWAPLCGNGRLDQDEACDEGDDNDDDEPDACRTSCEHAYCGDGTTDDGEDCDDGDDNSDTASDACRSDCSAPRCGDDVVDDGEDCDDGNNNSALAPDACRPDCSDARCGDDVVDDDEDCDDGDGNSDLLADACRSDCSEARCGDAVVDDGEQCDQGEDNDDARPDACRTDCTSARCGDGALDDGEACDDGEANDDARANACRTSCQRARCGDGVLDDGELCDLGEGSDCMSGCAASAGDGGAAGASGGDGTRGGEGGGKQGDAGGCSCRLTRATQPAGSGGLGGLGLLALVCLSRLRQRSRRDCVDPIRRVTRAR